MDGSLLIRSILFVAGVAFIIQVMRVDRAPRSSLSSRPPSSFSRSSAISSALLSSEEYESLLLSQSPLYRTASMPDIECHQGRGSLPSFDRLPDQFHGIHSSITHLVGAPSKLSFYRDFIKPSVPCVIHGVANLWPASALWTDDYLRSKIGDVIVKIERSNDNEFGHQSPAEVDWSFWSFSVSEFLDRYLLPRPEDASEIWNHWYLDTEFLPQLSSDVALPPFVPCLASNQPDFKRLFNIWMGGGDEVSLMHNDLEDNLLSVVHGFKVVYLVAPNTTSSFMYEDYDNETTETKLSEVDLRVSDQEMKERWPLFYENVTVTRVLLYPGDILFIPAMWWHQVVSSCRHLSVNFWFDTHDVRLKGDEWLWKHKTEEIWRELQTHASVCRE